MKNVNNNICVYCGNMKKPEKDKRIAEESTNKIVEDLTFLEQIHESNSKIFVEDIISKALKQQRKEIVETIDEEFKKLSFSHGAAQVYSNIINGIYNK